MCENANVANILSLGRKLQKLLDGHTANRIELIDWLTLFCIPNEDKLIVFDEFDVKCQCQREAAKLSGTQESGTKFFQKNSYIW